VLIDGSAAIATDVGGDGMLVVHNYVLRFPPLSVFTDDLKAGGADFDPNTGGAA
jgi:hypothetical protein